jgi:hypothetical protein
MRELTMEEIATVSGGTSLGGLLNPETVSNLVKSAIAFSQALPPEWTLSAAIHKEPFNATAVIDFTWS